MTAKQSIKKPPAESMRAALTAASEVMFADDHPRASALMFEIAHSMMNDMQLFPILCPELLAVMFEVAARRFPCAGEYFRYVLRARRFADVPQQLKRIKKEWERARNRLSHEVTAITDPEWHAESAVSPAEVVNMGAWLDSHPRPIRNLLFAEKR